MRLVLAALAFMAGLYGLLYLSGPSYTIAYHWQVFSVTAYRDGIQVRGLVNCEPIMHHWTSNAELEDNSRSFPASCPPVRQGFSDRMTAVIGRWGFEISSAKHSGLSGKVWGLTKASMRPDPHALWTPNERIYDFEVQLPFAVILPVLAIPFVLARMYRKRPLAGRCQKCGFDLRASVGRCPECGRTFGEAPASEAANESEPRHDAALSYPRCLIAVVGLKVAVTLAHNYVLIPAGLISASESHPWPILWVSPDTAYSFSPGQSVFQFFLRNVMYSLAVAYALFFVARIGRSVLRRLWFGTNSHESAAASSGS